MLLSVAYLPPVEYFALIARCLRAADSFEIEAKENFQKQSYRNRCTILSAGGPEDLLVPIVHRDGTHNGIPITEIEIDYSTPWDIRHERAIVSAYGTAPFFEYYIEDFLSILHSKPRTLWELDCAYISWLLRKLSISDSPLPLTTGFLPPASATALGGSATGSSADFAAAGGADYRALIHPKKPRVLDLDPYYQVFGPKYGFTPGLSAIDLLFNEGPDSLSHLL